MNLHYFLIQLNKRVASNRPKFLYLLLAHTLRLRHLYLQFDPNYSCNLACLMCNFSDPQVRKKFTRFTPQEVERIAGMFFPYCSNLQLGCDAEPAAYRDFAGLVEKARACGVPYISFTSNGQLLDGESLRRLDRAGLNELTLSAHGLTREVYERFMVKASFDKFTALLETIRATPHRFSLRLNYTVSGENFRDLALLPEWAERYGFDVVQIRQMLDVGQTGYRDFGLEAEADEYTEMIRDVKRRLAGARVQVFAEEIVARDVPPGRSNIFIPAILRRITPLRVWRDDFNWREESYWQYCRRTGYTRLLWWGVLGRDERLLDSALGRGAANAGRYY